MEAIQQEARKHGIDGKMSYTPRYSSKSTGAVGKAQDIIMKQVRTLKSALEAKI